MAFKEIKGWALKYNYAANRADLIMKLKPTGTAKLKSLRGDELKLILDILSAGHKHSINVTTKEIAVIDKDG